MKQLIARWMPTSLRGRLLVALLLTLLVFFKLGLVAYSFSLKNEQTGWWDSSLRVIAHQILLSLPQKVETLSSPDRPYRLPDGVGEGGLASRFDSHKPSFQVWVRGGREAFRSPGAPATPLRPDFGDGFADTEVDGQGWRVYSVSDATGRVQVQVAWTHAQFAAEHRRSVRFALGAAAVLFALLAFPVFAVICWSLRPVTQAEAAIRQRHALDLSPLPADGLPREIAPLVDAFNQLLQRLDGSLQGERRFIADAAHELRTPLAALLAHAELALSARDPAQGRAALQRLAEGVKRSTRLAEQLLDLARLDAGRTDTMRCIGLYEVVEVVVRDFELAAAQRGQRITLDLEPCEVVGDIDALGILVRNLLDNALRYSGDGGRVQVSCRGERGVVTLQVADDGPGVPEAERERIFDRFYRVAGNGGRGSGVGLSLVARIAELHHARIESGEGLLGRGFGIAVHFAAAPQEPPAPRTPRPDPTPGLPLAGGVRQH